MATQDPFRTSRQRMVNEQLRAPGRGIRNERVLAAMLAVPRHKFVPPSVRAQAYDDCPWPIGLGQTISQPYIVAFMTELAALLPTDRVLEIGTGCGYQPAVLAALVAEVFSIEVIPELAARAATNLDRLGVHNASVRLGDGRHGWPEEAPFDAVLVTCAPEVVPGSLFSQLTPKGRLIVPVGPTADQVLQRWEYRDGRWIADNILPVRFVPMTGGNEL